VEPDSFPQTLVELEGASGTASLGLDFTLKVVTAAGTVTRTVGPNPPTWSTPQMAHIQESVVRIQQHWADCLHEGQEPETSGSDNLQTLELAEAAYTSAERGEVVRV
jgi:predicted dehydrogenase